MSLLAAAHERLAAQFPRIVRAPSRVKFVEIQAWYTQWVGPGPTIQAFPYRKRAINMSGRVSLETATAPSNQFPLIKHVNFLQRF